jgi:biopolymer transport protein ExbD
MRAWSLVVMALFLSNQCFAMNATVELYILSNGHVRLDHGPELDEAHLVIKIRELMQQNPRPEIRILPTKDAKYSSVAMVFAAFQKVGYGPHFGFVGNMR